MYNFNETNCDAQGKRLFLNKSLLMMVYAVVFSRVRGFMKFIVQERNLGEINSDTRNAYSV